MDLGGIVLGPDQAIPANSTSSMTSGQRLLVCNVDTILRLKYSELTRTIIKNAIRRRAKFEVQKNEFEILKKKRYGSFNTVYLYYYCKIILYCMIFYLT